MRIVVLAYDKISPFMLSTPIAVFGEPALAGRHSIAVCASQPRLSASGGLIVGVSHPLKAARDADVVILPGWRDATEPIPADIVAELRNAGQRGAIIVGLCLGAFGLAEAGLLDGRRATTHWAFADALAASYPEIRVDTGALYVDAGQMLTSAGVASGLDCCLHLLARFSGIGEANRVARHLVVAPLRTGEQPQLIERPAIGSSTDQKVSELLAALFADPSTTPSLDELAERAGMSRRTLTRHIRSRTGGNLGGWLKRARLARAQEMLAGGARGLEHVAERCGFSDGHALRAAFRAELGVTPTQWLARQRLS